VGEATDAETKRMEGVGRELAKSKERRPTKKGDLKTVYKTLKTTNIKLQK